jgi:UDP-N-acetylmuramoylalanine--D-glutamate ligase
MLELKGRKVLVLGLGDTGLSMTRWLSRHGAQVRVADSRQAPPHAGTLADELPQVDLAAGAFHERDFAHADMIAISPGLDRRQPLVADAIRRGIPVVGDVELFAQALDSPNAQRSTLIRPKVLAVTGSNGKSTVTAMAGAMCRAAGRSTVVAGNIGLPVLDALTATERDAAPTDAFVLELSSFQLESTASLRPDAAAMLNLTGDHLDRYDGMTEYAAAKARIFAGAGAQVLNRDDARSMAMAQPGRAVWSFGLDEPRAGRQWGVLAEAAGPVLARGARGLMPLAELPLAGRHNAANALAALALAHAIALPEPPLLDALREFRGLPHRLQRIAEVGGVVFYDDSKGTNVGASVAALSGMSQPVVLIAGGDGKGQEFLPLAQAVARHARAVVLIGRDAPLIDKVLVHSGVTRMRAGSMDEAVRTAYAASRPGDAVLLSPACASYDMFRSYVQRGEAFAAAVGKLAKGGEA